MGRRIDTVVYGKDFDIFDCSVLTLSATAAILHLTVAAAIPNCLSRTMPQVLLRSRDDKAGVY
jgi:hypothetical protein